MDEILTPYDPADTLRSAEAVILFLADAIETKEDGYIAHAMAIADRAEGMAEISRKTGLGTEALCASLRASPTINSLSSLLATRPRNEAWSARTA